MCLGAPLVSSLLAFLNGCEYLKLFKNLRDRSGLWKMLNAIDYEFFIAHVGLIAGKSMNGKLMLLIAERQTQLPRTGVEFL